MKKGAWAFSAGTVDGDFVGELTEAHNRKLTVNLEDACSASFTIDGRSDQALLLNELATDLYVHYDRELLFRGRLTAGNDDITDKAHECTFVANDYRELIGHRILAFDHVFTAAAATDMLWELIDANQGQPGGNWGITRGVTGGGGVLDHTVPAGKSLKEAGFDIGHLWPGFDWQIGPNLTFDTWARRGAVKDLALVYGDTCSRVRRIVDSTNYGNDVRQTGAAGLTPTTATAADIAARTEGLWQIQASNPDLKTQAAVDAAAPQTLIDHEDLTPTFTFTALPGIWTPDQLWVGDTTKFACVSGRIRVQSQERVSQIVVNIGDGGTGDVTADITFGNLRQALIRLSRPRLLAAIEALART